MQSAKWKAELMRRKGAIFLAIIILSAALSAVVLAFPNPLWAQDQPLGRDAMDDPTPELSAYLQSLGTSHQARDSNVLRDAIAVPVTSLFNPDQELEIESFTLSGDFSSANSLSLQIPQQGEITAQVEIRGKVLTINSHFLTLIERIELPQVVEKSIIVMDAQWLAIDATGTGEGWQLNIKATEFENEDGYKIPAKALEITLLDESIFTVAGNTKPSSMNLSSTPLSSSSQVLALAPRGEGMGSFSLTPTFSIEIPTGSSPGPYFTHITLTILTGP